MATQQTAKTVLGQELDEDLNVLPGTIIASQAPSILWGTIGAGVSVCIWNSIDRIGGMNHFLLPATNDQAKTYAKFGNVAMYGVTSMLAQRSTIPLFEASIVGAAFSDEFEEENGRQLIAVAEKFLWQENIPVALQETGGSVVRHVTFDIETGRICIA